MRDNVPILLIEDDKIDVQNVRRAFKKNKTTNPLFVAKNGEEALAILRNEGDFIDSGIPRPSLILLDINMPVMNGIEFLQVMKSDPDLKSIPVIVLTTSQEERDRLESFQMGVAGYIIKPVDFPKFVDAVKVIDLYWTLSELP